MNSLITGSELGKYDVYDGDHLLGVEGTVPDLNYSSTTRELLSHEEVHVRVCRNNAGVALLPGQLVTHDTGSTYGPGLAAGVKAGGTAVVGLAGVVDPYLPAAGVPDGSNFLLIIEGPCSLRYDGSANIAIGDILVSAANGRCLEYITGSHDQGAPVAIAKAAKASGSADDLFRARLRRMM